jgi:ferredoxin-thioredoxin reductase catalytic subunit
MRVELELTGSDDDVALQLLKTLLKVLKRRYGIRCARCRTIVATPSEVR